MYYEVTGFIKNGVQSFPESGGQDCMGGSERGFGALHHLPSVVLANTNQFMAGGGHSGSCPAPVYPKAKLHVKGWIARLRMSPSALGFTGDIRNWYKEEDRAMPFGGSTRQIQQYLLKMI